MVYIENSNNHYGFSLEELQAILSSIKQPSPIQNEKYIQPSRKNESIIKNPVKDYSFFEKTIKDARTAYLYYDKKHNTIPEGFSSEDKGMVVTFPIDSTTLHDPYHKMQYIIYGGYCISIVGFLVLLSLCIWHVVNNKKKMEQFKKDTIENKDQAKEFLDDYFESNNVDFWIASSFGFFICILVFIFIFLIHKQAQRGVGYLKNTSTLGVGMSVWFK